MSLQGTGSASQYWSGAGPFSGYADRPFTMCLWFNTADTGNTTQGLLALKTAWAYGDTGLGCYGYVGGVVAPFYDFTDTTGSTNGVTSVGGPQNSWNFVAFILAAAGNDTCYFNAQDGGGIAVAAAPATYAELELLTNHGNATLTGTMIGEVTIWSGALSAIDIAKLYSGGAGGKGVNPLNLVSSNGASLVRYYLPVGGANDFADHSGNGGATLAAQGGAVPTWNASDPPVGMSGTVSAVAPLITCLW